MKFAITVVLIVVVLAICVALASWLREPSTKDEWRRPKEVLKCFNAISDEWLQLLRQQLAAANLMEEVHWSESKPVVLQDGGPPFLFKEFRYTTMNIDVDVEGDSGSVVFRGNGYAVAMLDEIRDWKPTTICYLEKSSPEEAMAELQMQIQKELEKGDSDR